MPHCQHRQLMMMMTEHMHEMRETFSGVDGYNQRSIVTQTRSNQRLWPAHNSLMSDKSSNQLQQQHMTSSAGNSDVMARSVLHCVRGVQYVGYSGVSIEADARSQERASALIRHRLNVCSLQTDRRPPSHDRYTVNERPISFSISLTRLSLSLMASQ